MNNNKQILQYIKTMENCNKTLKIAVKNNDPNFIIELVSKLISASSNLLMLMEMDKKKNFTA